MYVSTNRLDWNQVELPPRLRESNSENWNREAREKYSELWKQYLDP